MGSSPRSRGRKNLGRQVGLVSVSSPRVAHPLSYVSAQAETMPKRTEKRTAGHKKGEITLLWSKGGTGLK